MRFDHVGITVADLDMVTAFFVRPEHEPDEDMHARVTLRDVHPAQVTTPTDAAREQLLSAHPATVTSGVAARC
jgi:catechol 2,3-dioxygenase-like lactoylglutathione lyase family enzyme